MEYAVMISYLDPNDPTNPKTIILDTVNDTGIDSTSTVTTHPTVNGTPMSDHMYRNPINVNLNGTFSLNGKKGIVVEHGHGSLARVEDMFEEIKDSGTICTICKVVVDENGRSTPRFSYRDNMLLNSIHWNEKVNSLDFQFGFQEVLRSTVQTVQVDPDDRFAPSIEFPQASNFSDTLLNWDEVDKEVINALWDFDLIAQEFLEYLGSLTAGALVAIGIGFAVAVAFASTIIALGLSVPVVGWIVAAAAAIVIGIIALVKWIKRQSYRIKAFKYYKNPKKRDDEVERFVNFYEDIHDRVRSLDGVIKCYNITQNIPQETIVTISGQYYLFTFEKNNLNDGSSYAYKLNIADINGTTIKDVDTNWAIGAYADGTPTNCVVELDGNYVYLIRTSESEEDKADLTRYIICVSAMNPEDFSEALKKIIKEAIKY